MSAIGYLKLGVSLLIVGLGLVIVGRGVMEAAPLSFTLMGVLMVVLGLYRWRFLLGESGGKHR